jgi:hypothetical protein
MDRSEMAAMQYREETGYLPDESFDFSEEFDPTDPEQYEIAQEVMDRYARTNEQRRAQRDRDYITTLAALLEENGIDVPERF